MPSTSIPQPARHHGTAVRRRDTAALRTAPGQGAIHAGPGGLARRRAELEARWRDRLERVTALSLAYHDEVERSGSVAVAAAQPGAERPAADRPAADRRTPRRVRLLARRAVAERQALAEIEAALDRIATGRYGRCEQCGRPIGAGLLAAAPQARYCAACSRQAAHRMAYA
jgi:RNA polymerase-binding transcription factor DksA